jgi:diapolycopene oxygenase
MMEKKKAVVIGAGLGGLAVAGRLAALGWRVTVCEQGVSLGGKMNRWRVAGYTFDTGPSLITMPWVFGELFAALGERAEDHVRFMRVNPMAEYHYPDGTRFAHTGDLPSWLETVRKLSKNDAAGFFGFMALGERLFAVSRETFFKNAPGKRLDLSALRVLPRMPLRWAWGRYHRTVEHFLGSPHLRQMFERYITYVGSSPYLAPATLSVIPFIEYAFGVWHVQGGLYRVVESLATLLEKFGVELRAGARAVRIVRSGCRVTGVELEDGTVLSADVVVMNGDASRRGALLGEGEGSLPAEQRSMSGFVMMFALSEELPQCQHHSVYFSSDYREEFRQLFDERRFPDEPTVYVNMPSRTDRSVVPRGEAMFVMANAPANGDQWDEAHTARAKASVLGKLRAGGFPEFAKWVVAESVFTPRDFAQRYDMPGGAIYGQASHGWRGAFWRPPNRDRHVKGLYYVGGSTHPGGGTPTVLLSAEITAKLIERYESG